VHPVLLLLIGSVFGYYLASVLDPIHPQLATRKV
jgi:hypothetical protein